MAESGNHRAAGPPAVGARRAVVVGAGIGGLAAALGLRRAGWDVVVLERAAATGEVGAGIAIWANGLRALDRLGAGAAVRAAGHELDAGWIRSDDGMPLMPLATPGLRARLGELGVLLHRAALHRALLDALGHDAVRTGAAVEAVEPERARVRLAGGEPVAGDVVIGADGLRSTIRAALHGDRPPRYAGYTSWRAVIPFPEDRLLPGETWGAGARFGQAPLGDGRVYLFATKSGPAGARSPDGERAELLRTFGGWHAPIPALVAACRDEDLIRTDIHDRPPLATWGRGPVTLLGDAAHPMTPNLGQGATQALEDAVELAARLAAEPDPAAALRQYEQLRARRVDRLVTQSRRLGALGQWRWGPALRLRAALLRHVLSRLQERQLGAMLSAPPAG